MLKLSCRKQSRYPVGMDTNTTTETNGDQSAQRVALPQRSEQEVQAYHQAKRICHLAGIAISIVYWAIWLGLAGGFVNWLDLHLDARWLGMAATAVVMFAGQVFVLLPLHYYSSFLLERQYDLTNQTPWTWLIFEMKSWLVGVVIGGILLAGLYSLLWYAGALWSVWVWVGVMAFSVLLAKVFPLIILPLFYPSEPLDRPSLADRLTQMAADTGMTVTGIFNLALSKETKKANAMLAGLGSSRRVYLSDTLLDAFEDDQIAIVFAHELGHHIRGHIFKSIAMAAVISSLLVALFHWRLNPFAGGDPADWRGAVSGLAQIGFIMAVFPLLIGPVTNAISRHFERQADTDALRLTNDPDAYRGAFRLLTDMNLADPNPPLWEEIMFEDHPPMAKRIAMADEYVIRSTEPDSSN